MSGNHKGGWSEKMGGSDESGNPLTVAFGEGSKEGHTLLGDGDRSESNFHDSPNHNHYGSGDGPNDNVGERDQYHGDGH